MNIAPKTLSPTTLTLQPTIKILLIEDLASDARLIEEYLLDSELKRHKLYHVETLARGREVLYEEEIDIILVDLFLPDCTGLATFETIFHEFFDYPIIVLTGLSDELLGLRAVQKGAQDFLNKSDLDSLLLSRSIKYALERHRMLHRLEQAQQLAKVGHWEADLATQEFHFSNQIYSIFERGPAANFETFNDYVTAIAEEDQEMVARAFLEAMNAKRDFQIDHRILCSGNRIKFISLHGKYIPRAMGLPGQMLGTAQDITERKQIDILTREKEFAERAVRLRQEFLAKTSHEIRNPLNPILVLTDILLTTGLTPEQKEYLLAIKNAGANLLAVVNDILDLSKIEAGKIEFNRRSFKLDAIFDHLQDILHSSSREKGLELDFHLAEGTPSGLIGDPVRLTQILMNLVSNAIKFTQRGIIQTSVRLLEGGKDHCTLEFSVKDTGLGIPQDKLQQIFDSFSQLHSDPEQPNEGAGLGLSIAHQLVTLQGGSIWVESQVNRGSTFYFRLKFEISADAPESFQAVPGFEKYNLRGVKILLVEDNPLNQLVTTKVLTDWQAEVDVADNGKACIPLMLKKDYDVVLMDLHMPEMDGFEATRFIRERMDAPACYVPILALTADAQEGHDAACIQAGMNDFITKPFEVATLYTKIAKQLKLLADQPEPDVDSFPSFSSQQPEQNPSEKMTPTKYTNLAYLKEVTSNDVSTIRKTIQRFLELMPDMIQLMQQQLASKDFEQVGRTAHKMKMPVAFMGIEMIKSDVLRVEVICKSNEGLEDLPQLVNRITDFVQKSFPELEETLANL